MLDNKQKTETSASFSSCACPPDINLSLFTTATVQNLFQPIGPLWFSRSFSHVMPVRPSTIQSQHKHTRNIWEVILKRRDSGQIVMLGQTSLCVCMHMTLSKTASSLDSSWSTTFTYMYITIREEKSALGKI